MEIFFQSIFKIEARIMDTKPDLQTSKIQIVLFVSSTIYIYIYIYIYMYIYI